MAPIYKYDCECGEEKEIIESISAHCDRKFVPCCKCKKHMKQNYEIGSVSEGIKTLGGWIDYNTQRLSLDEKIALGTKNFSGPQKEKEIRKITKNH